MTCTLKDLHSCFLIVDASGLIYRSFFAVRGLMSPKGEPTGALYGFIRSLTKAISDLQPSAIATVFDGPNNKASRLQFYPEYKAHRKPTPPELISQINDARRFCEIAHLTYLDIPGVEADDTIASVVQFALEERNRQSEHNKPIVILSADKDLMQLVQNNVFIMNPMKDYSIYDEKAVLEEWQLAPHEIRDFLAIVGDSSDNVPGISGLGPKAALKLIQEWKSFHRIYENISAISGKVQEKLIVGKEKGELSFQLITLQNTVDIPKTHESYLRKDSLGKEELPDALIHFYQEKGFKSLYKHVNQSTRPNASPRALDPQLEFFSQAPGAFFEDKTHSPIDSSGFPACSVQIISTTESLSDFVQWLSEQKKGVAIDTETTSLDEYSAELVGIGIAAACDTAFYIDFAHSDLNPHTTVAHLSEALHNHHIPIIGHNCKYDLHVLYRYGLRLPGILSDTLVASWLLNPEERTHSLDTLALRIFNKQKIPIESLIGKKERGKPQGSMKDVPQELISKYCAEDVEYTLRLYDYFEKRLSQSGKLKDLFDTVEIPLLPILFRMEERGIFVNVDTLVSLRSQVNDLLKNAEKCVFEMAGEEFNLNSPKQLSHILYTKLGLPAIKKGKTALSTDAEVLEELAQDWPIATAVLEYRQLEKLRSTYIDLLPTFIRPDTGRIHCRFLQSGTATGRLSCQDPNLQNIPVRSELGKAIRSAFEPQQKGWKFLSFDYSQIELRILAHMSQDPTLIEAFHHGLDIHAITAKEIFHVPLQEVTPEMRRRAKAVNFGVIYGQKSFGLSKELHIPVKEANQFITSYFHRYQTVEKTIEELKQKARTTGYAETLTGRMRHLPDIHSSNHIIRASQERLAVNTPFQGTAADIIKMAMIQVEKKLNNSHFRTQMLLQIHDELLFEAPDEEIDSVVPIIQQEMENVMKLSVPMKVDVAIGKNWKEC